MMFDPLFLSYDPVDNIRGVLAARAELARADATAERRQLAAMMIEMVEERFFDDSAPLRRLRDGLAGRQDAESRRMRAYAGDLLARFEASGQAAVAAIAQAGTAPRSERPSGGAAPNAASRAWVLAMLGRARRVCAWLRSRHAAGP